MGPFNRVGAPAALYGLIKLMLFYNDPRVRLILRPVYPPWVEVSVVIAHKCIYSVNPALCFASVFPVQAKLN